MKEGSAEWFRELDRLLGRRSLGIRGRPRKILNEELIIVMRMLGYSNKVIAQDIGVNNNTVARRIKDMVEAGKLDSIYQVKQRKHILVLPDGYLMDLKNQGYSNRLISEMTGIPCRSIDRYVHRLVRLGMLDKKILYTRPKYTRSTEKEKQDENIL